MASRSRRPAPAAAAQETAYGATLQPAVQNTITLTLAFMKAVGAGQKDKGDNLVVSPYNALAALSMVAKGADGKTRDEMAHVLFGVKGKDLDASAKAYADLNEELLAANKGAVELTTANGIWVNKKQIKLDGNFADEMKGQFKAEISEENFGKPTANKINKWASDNTKGLINKVLDDVKPDDLAILASALYFKGQWTHKFDKSLTENKDYAQDGGAVSKTPTMHQDYGRKENFSIAQGKDFDAVALSYGEKDAARGKNPTMRIVLVRPKDGATAARDWLASQADGKVPQWLDPAAYQKATGSVELPRLDIKQTFDLIPAMQDMGIKQAFTGAADFSKMVTPESGKLMIGKISHDTVFKTDEEGSEAAAVTVVGMKRSAAIMPPPLPHLDVKFDRSFVFALQDVKTGAVLFMGAVNKPNDDMRAGKKARAPVQKR